MNHKAGFLAIAKLDVGKSTLMNKILGEQLSVVTPKAQTTRHRIKGILTTDDYQLVFSDSGILKPAYNLHKRMMKAVDSTIIDADVAMFVVEVKEKRLSEDVALHLKKLEVPLVIVVNKIDQADQAELEERVTFWKNELNPVAIIPVSATESFNVDSIVLTL